MSLYKNALKEAAFIFLLSRIAILFITYIGISIFPLANQPQPLNCLQDLHGCLHAWWHWDVNGYLGIAVNGYSNLRDTVFFPLLPFLIHWLALPLGASPGAYYAVGMLLTNLCFYVALVLLYCLISQDFAVSTARKALFYLAFSPFAVFFFLIYTEALLLMLCLAAFFFLRRGNTLDWWLAGSCGFLAMLTRSSGLLLMIPYMVLWLQRFWFVKTPTLPTWQQRFSTLLPILLIPAGLLPYMLYLKITHGDPLAFSTQEAIAWTRPFSMPWKGILQTLPNLINISPRTLINQLDLAFLLIPIVALIVGWRRLPLHYNLYAMAMIVFPLFYTFADFEPLLGFPRYMVVIFPITVLFAQWGKWEKADQIFVVLSLAMFAFNIMRFVCHYWVA